MDGDDEQDELEHVLMYLNGLNAALAIKQTNVFLCTMETVFYFIVL